LISRSIEFFLPVDKFLLSYIGCVSPPDLICHSEPPFLRNLRTSLCWSACPERSEGKPSQQSSGTANPLASSFSYAHSRACCF